MVYRVNKHILYMIEFVVDMISFIVYGMGSHHANNVSSNHDAYRAPVCVREIV